MLNFSDSLLVGALLQALLFAVAGSQAGLPMGGGMRIKNSDIKKCSFEPASPETIGGNVEACTILNIRGSTCEDFPGDWLQFRFNTDIATDFG